MSITRRRRGSWGAFKTHLARRELDPAATPGEVIGGDGKYEATFGHGGTLAVDWNMFVDRRTAKGVPSGSRKKNAENYFSIHIVSMYRCKI